MSTETLTDEIATAEQTAKDSSDAAMNSYGAGFDAGYARGLKEARRLLAEEK